MGCGTVIVVAYGLFPVLELYAGKETNISVLGELALEFGFYGPWLLGLALLLFFFKSWRFFSLRDRQNKMKIRRLEESLDPRVNQIENGEEGDPSTDESDEGGNNDNG